MCPSFPELWESGQVVPEIEHDYQMRMMAYDVRALRQYGFAALHLQAEAAAEHLRAIADLQDTSDSTNIHLEELNETIGTLLSGVDHINDSLENLTEVGVQTLNAIEDISGIIDAGLKRISQQMLDARQLMKRVDDSLRHPYKSQERELREEADKWLTRGMDDQGPDQKEDWNDAMRLLRVVVENSIGRQDYVAFFQLGYLLWKHEKNVSGVDPSAETIS